MPVCFSFANLIFILIHVLLLIQFRVARVGYPIAAVIGFFPIAAVCWPLLMHLLISHLHEH